MIIPKQYIQMCRMAPELKEHKPQEGDLYALPNGVVFVVASYCFRVENTRLKKIYLAIPPKMRPSQIDGKPDFTSPTYEKREYERYPLKYWTWLPSQAQLQKMILCSDPFTGTDQLHNYINELRRENRECITLWKYNYTSREELWFAFVWKKLYDKVWNSKIKRWIKTDSL